MRMNYNQLLNKIMNESGLSQKEIIIKCQEQGINMKQGYISNLKTVEGRIASDEISLAIARACNAEYEYILIVQAYLDKAPQYIIDFIEKLKTASKLNANMIIKAKAEHIPEEIKTTLKTEIEKEIDQKSLAEFICEYNEKLNTPTEEKLAQQIKNIENMFDIAKANTQTIENQEEKWLLIPLPSDAKIKILNRNELKKLT